MNGFNTTSVETRYLVMPSLLRTSDTAKSVDWWQAEAYIGILFYFLLNI